MHATGKPLTRWVDLNLLELFDTVYRLRNLTAAGQRLGLSQSAVSHGLGKLRDAYGDPLFVRTQRGVQPTPFADALAEPVANALEIVRSTLARPVFEPAQEQRVFRIAMTDVGERMFLPHVLSWMSGEAPGIRLETSSPGLAELYDGLGSGEIDLAVGFIPGLGKQVRQHVLFHERFVYMMRRGHPDYAPALSVAHIQRLPHAIADPLGTDHAAAVEKVLADSGVRANIALRVRSFLGLAPIVAETDLIAPVPSNLGRTMAGSRQLEICEPPVSFPGFDVSVYWHQRFHQDPASAWLRNGFASLFQDARPFR